MSNITIIEELGQINYLFSDKTGTLTKNEMVMKAISVAGSTIESGDKNRFEQIYETEFKPEIIKSGGTAQMTLKSSRDKVREFMKVLSLAHECVRDQTSEGVFYYKGPSPDEVQLAEFAH